MLIDTDIFIWLLRGNEKVADFLDTLESFYISDMTYMELIQGTLNKREMQTLHKILIEMDVARIPLDPTISAKASLLVEKYAHSHSVHAADALIAATALSYKHTLVSGNKKHFLPIPDLDLHEFSV